MNFLKLFFALLFLSLLVYSCVPEEVPRKSDMPPQTITAETDDQGDEVIDRERDKH